MSEAQIERQFNFGPIARTDAGGTHNTFNLAGLPLHVMLDALMASTNRDEFVAWLWHDLFKPAFRWNRRGGEFKWDHTPGYGGSVFERAEAVLASTSVTNIPVGLVSTHHSPRPFRGLPHFTVLEQDVISDQVDQINLGAASVYLQLAFAVEPAMSTALVRTVIADSFVEAVTKSVARELSKMLASKVPTFSRVRFVFEIERGLKFSKPPADSEIWSQVGQKYDIRQVGDELVIHHFTPVESADGFATEVVMDLTGAAPTPEQTLKNTLGLAELLIAYQDDRTILMTLPQPIYPLDTNELQQEILSLVRTKLNALNVLTTGDGIDLLEAAFDSQIVIREAPNRLPIPPNPHVTERSPHLRPIDQVVAYAGELLSHAASRGRYCRICGSAFESKLPPRSDWPGRDFNDSEFLGFSGDICPMCRIYALNSHQWTNQEKTNGATGNRRALRGSFALLLPSSHFDVNDANCRLIEQPPLDIGGRFASSDPNKPLFQRVTVTQQEYVLFNQISRRIIASLWRKIEPDAQLPLPYLGGIILTDRERKIVYKILPAFRELFTEVTLLAYPFQAKVVPGVEIALDIVLEDRKQHHTKHTYLKSRASVLPIHPESRILVLADGKLQIEISRDWFEAYDETAKYINWIVALQQSERRWRLANREKFKRIVDDEKAQPEEWMRALIGGDDPATAFYESVLTRMTRGDDARAFNITADFWTTQFGPDSAQAWFAYEQKRNDLREIFLRYPMLAELFSAFTERKETENDGSDTTDSGEETDESGASRSPRRGRRAATAKRPRARRKARGKDTTDHSRGDTP